MIRKYYFFITYNINYKMGNTEFLMISQIKELDLFHNIYYKYIKDIINHDDDEIAVYIEDLPCGKITYCKMRFTFEMGDKKFVEEKEYINCSDFALLVKIIGIQRAKEDEEEESDEEE